MLRPWPATRRAPADAPATARPDRFATVAEMSRLPDATALAQLVRRGEASPLELVDEAIERIERHNPVLNALIHERFDAARAEAAAPIGDGPFAGVPMLVKDLGCEMAGEPSHHGCAGLRDAGLRADVDSFLYESFRAAGLIALGRTNVPEFGSTITTEPTAYGPSRNPWNTEHSTGGSSGGSAAAVASGMVPAAHANDGGGSIRIPASECGLVGLKPSRGRVSHGPLLGESWAGATIDGVVTRTVRDTAGLLDAIRGRRVGDPYVASPPGRPFVDEVGADVGRLRVGLMTTSPGGLVDGECEAAVEHTGSLLESLGHEVAFAHPEKFWVEEFGQHFITVISVNLARDFDVFAKTIGRPLAADEVEADNWTMHRMGREIAAPDYLASVDWLHAWSRELQEWWYEHDVLVSPVIAVPPPELGWLRDPEYGSARLAEILLFTTQFNVSGQPAISLPLHHSADGLPIGVQFAGQADGEAGLLRLASQIEAAAPWADRHPPIWA